MKLARPEWEVSAYEVFAEPILAELERYHELVATADIIVSQPIHDGYRGRDDLSLSYVRRSAKPGATILVFPSMHFEGQLIDCRSLSIRAHGMDYHNVLLVHLVAAGLHAASAFRILAQTDLYPPQFVASEMRRSIEEARRREIIDAVDVPFVPFLEAFTTRVQLFHTTNHPYRPALVWITRRILHKLGIPLSIEVPPPDGPEPIPFPHIPLPPSVKRLLTGPDASLAGWTTPQDEVYHLPNEVMGILEYYECAARNLASYKAIELIQFLAESRARSFLARLARVRPDLPGIGFWRRFAGD